MSRNKHYERGLLDVAARRARVDATAFIEVVMARLELGAQRYGDNDYLSKDCFTAALEESPDHAAYLALESQKLATRELRGEIDLEQAGEIRAALVEAIHHTVLADSWTRIAQDLTRRA